MLDAADALLEEEGLQGFTLRGCARRAQVSHAAPKHHFGDARGLLTAVATRGFDRLCDELRRAVSLSKGNLEEEIVAISRAYVHFAERNPEHFRVMFRRDLVCFDPVTGPPSVRGTFVELTNVILRQRGEPELPEGDMSRPEGEALINDILMGWSHIHGYAHLRAEGQLTMVPQADHEAHLEQAARRLGHILRPGDHP